MRISGLATVEEGHGRQEPTVHWVLPDANLPPSPDWARAHQDITVTIQHALGNNSNHPLGSNSMGPYTKRFLHF